METVAAGYEIRCHHLLRDKWDRPLAMCHPVIVTMLRDRLLMPIGHDTQQITARCSYIKHLGRNEVRTCNSRGDQKALTPPWLTLAWRGWIYSPSSVTWANLDNICSLGMGTWVNRVKPLSLETQPPRAFGPRIESQGPDNSSSKGRNRYRR